MTNSLYLDTKLQPASVDERQVPRPRIVDAVQAASMARLVLVRAPAGYGKTTAMVQLRRSLEDAGRATAWLTLDAADNDLSRFMHCLGHALKPIPGFDSPADVHDAADLHLLDRLARCTQPFALFLDDVESIHDKAVIDAVQHLVEQLPACGMLVLGSRTQPDLRLGRLRARRQLVEVDAAALRFSLDETRDLLGVQGHAMLQSADVQRLHAKTEGWIAGLWLASMALEGQSSKADFIARFSGSDVAVGDYLLDDVFRHQTPAMQDFLLRTSVLKVLTPPLCEALVPGVDAARVLRELGAHNVLLTPIDGEEGGFRYHSLFAGFLQAQLRHTGRERLPALHRAAAQWFEVHDRPVPAIDHLLESGDVDAVLSLLSRHVIALLSRGRMRLLARWFSALPAGALDAHPQLKAAQMWAVCFTRGPGGVIQDVETSGLTVSEDPEVWPLVSALQPVLLSMLDRHEEAYEAGRRGLARLPSQIPMADNVLVNIMSHIFSMKGLSFEALDLMDTSRRAQAVQRSTLNSMYAETMEGTLDLFEGRVREAHSRFRAAVAESSMRSDGPTYGNAWPGMLYASTFYELNEVATATELLRIYLPTASDVGLPDHIILGYRMLARLAFDGGDVDECFRLLTELEGIGHQRLLPRVVASAHLERARVQLLQGRAASARVELERADNGAVWRNVSQFRLLGNDADDLTLGRLRWEAVAGDARHATLRLAREAADAVGAQRHRRAVACRLLHAIALIRCEGVESALSLLAQTLRRCASQGFTRLVLDEGPGMAMLVGQLAASLKADDPNDVLVRYVGTLVQAFGLNPAETGAKDEAVASDAAATAQPMPALLDPLTQKELLILRLLADGYSNSAISEKLFISDSTVRTHLRNINSKLSVGSRSQAVSAARRLGLVR